ncbi:MAG TPA: tRNA (adenosine(37)-N6)-threonylcarbamoyltransferase complex transferase subunit TsaD [bacterium]|nr:tRNA (adenosine(37)-N6)-threonylcarbamoyltransferase complex transferase subunit TsaD [bacterium]
MLILGIETSCDETAASVVKDGKRILSNVIASQVAIHRKFWGVVPEIASRKHLELINPVISEALSEAKIGFSDLDGIAVTYGPGLVGALLVGLSTAKAIAYADNLPFVGINHLEGHIYANYLEHPSLKFPFLALIVSGGHSDLVYVKDHGKYEVMGRTRDDAPGEAFDKIAKFLKLGYPGGPIIDTLSKKGNPKAISFPRSCFKAKETLDFSFSGIKTAVVNYIAGRRSQVAGRRSQIASHMLLKNDERQSPDEIGTGDKRQTKWATSNKLLCNIVASFQEAIVDMLIKNTLRAAKIKGVERIVLAGGVAANSRLRERLREETTARDIRLIFPREELCTDNAAMIACCGYYKLKERIRSDLLLNAVANLSLGKTV